MNRETAQERLARARTEFDRVKFEVGDTAEYRDAAEELAAAERLK